VIPTHLSLSTRELELVIAAADELRSPADRVRLLEGVADELMHAPAIDPAAVALAVRRVLKRLTKSCRVTTQQM
jgi:hypothetical protein